MLIDEYWKIRIESILEQKSSKEKKVDAIWTLLLESNVKGRKDLASELRNLLQVKDDFDDSSEMDID